MHPPEEVGCLPTCRRRDDRVRAHSNAPCALRHQDVDILEDQYGYGCGRPCFLAPGPEACPTSPCLNVCSTVRSSHQINNNRIAYQQAFSACVSRRNRPLQDIWGRTVESCISAHRLLENTFSSRLIYTAVSLTFYTHQERYTLDTKLWDSLAQCNPQ